MNSFFSLISVITITLILGCSSLSLAQMAPQELDYKKIKISDGPKFRIPENFVVMPDFDYESKFLTTKKPIAKYTDEGRIVSFIYNKAPNQWSSFDLPMLSKFYKSSFLQLYDNVEFLTDTIKEVNGSQAVFMEFTSEKVDETGRELPARNYHIIQYFVQKGRIHIFSILMPLYYKDQWSGVAKEILASVKMS